MCSEEVDSMGQEDWHQSQDGGEQSEDHAGSRQEVGEDFRREDWEQRCL